MTRTSITKLKNAPAKAPTVAPFAKATSVPREETNFPPNTVMLKHKELVTLILRARGIHEGIWMAAANLGFTAITVGPDEQNINPAGVVSILGFGITKVDKMSALSVDAALENPLPKSKKKQS